jgi:hypothetical protein
MRFRVAASLAALVLLVILVQSGAMVLLLHDKEEEFIEKQLGDQIEHSMELFRRSPDATLPSTPAMWLYRVGPGAPGDQLPPLFRGLAVGNHEVYLGSKEYHVAVREDQGTRYILAYDVEEHESRLNNLMLITVSAAIGLALLTLLAGYALAGRLTGTSSAWPGASSRSRRGRWPSPGWNANCWPWPKPWRNIANGSA